MFWEADKDMHADSISLQVLKKCIVCQPAPVWHMCVFSGFYLKMICEFSYRNVQLPLYTLVLGRFLSSKFREKKIVISSIQKRSTVGSDWKKTFPIRTFEQVAHRSCKSWRFWRPDWTKPWTTWSVLRADLALSTR